MARRTRKRELEMYFRGMIVFNCVLWLYLIFGDVPSRDVQWDGKRFEEICLKGVTYYIRAPTLRSYMAVAIDKDTLKPKPCDTAKLINGEM